MAVPCVVRVGGGHVRCVWRFQPVENNYDYTLVAVADDLVICLM